MKGISAVIATILLLLITIAIVGFAFGFFQRIVQSSSGSATTQLDTTLAQTGQFVNIDNAADTSVTLRNTGTGAISTSSLSFYVAGASITCTFVPDPTTIAPSALESCTLRTSCSGQTLRVTTAGGEDSYPCV